MKKIYLAIVLLLAVTLLGCSGALADASGTCGDYGDNLTWTLTGGVLTISGEGGMYNYPAHTGSPWSYSPSVTSVVIEDGVTSIGDYAFIDCANLTSVRIPDSVNQIGDSAFSGCTSLTNISIPDSVTEIGKYAFSYCPLTNFALPTALTYINIGLFSYTNLTSVTIPEHITVIRNSAFYGCENLSSVTLHNNITEIQGSAFKGCPKLKSVSIPDGIAFDVSAFDSSSTILYIELGSAALDSLSGAIVYFRDPDYPDCILYKEGPEYVFYKYDNPESTHVVIPEGVTRLGRSAFYQSTTITSVTLPESLITIQEYAFDGCNSLASIVIPCNVTTIGSDAFAHCTALTGMLQLPDSVEYIYRGAFNYCTGLTGLLLPDHVKMVEYSDVDMYANRESETALLNSYTIPGFRFIDPDYPELYLLTFKTEEGTIGYEVVGAKPSITKIDASTFPEGTTLIGSAAFGDCDQLVSVTIPEYITSVGPYAFHYSDNLTSVTYDAPITVLRGQTFSNCTSLRSVTLPDCLTTIEGAAFHSCKQLKSIHIPDRVTLIGSDAFAYSGLTSITLPGSIGKVNSFVFYDCKSLSSVTLGEGITAIEDYAFAGVTSMGRMYIPNSCTSIGEQEYSEYVSAYEPPRIHPFSYHTTDVYCYEFSFAEHWGRENCRKVILLDGKEEGENLTVTLPETLTASVGTPVNIPATIFPESDSQTITWTSSNPDVASVDASGKLSPLKAGVTTITLTVNGVSATCEVTVYYALTSLVLPEMIYVVAKDGVQLPVTIVPADAACELTYSIDKENFGSISSTGWISAPSYIPSPNTATITVRDRITGKTATTQLYVAYPVTAVSFAQDTVDLAPGATFQLTANVTMRSDSCVNQLVTFTSSDENVGTVDQHGLLTAKAGGTITVTAAASNGVSAQCTVNVLCDHVVEMLPAVAPTCTEDGLTEGTHCSVCGAVITEQTVIPATGHTEGERIIVTEPTDTKPGAAVVYCTICNETLRTEEIPATGVVYAPGDASGDGKIDIFDALAILQFDVGWETSIYPEAADVNDSGTVDIFDALLILQYDVGWDVELK